MDELAFPVAAVAATFFGVLPALTVLSRVVLTLRRGRARAWTTFGSEVTFAWLVAPTLLPVLWLTSSALHQTEPRQTAASCLIDHVEATTCVDTLLLLALLLLGMAVSVGARLWRERPRVALGPTSGDEDLRRRVDALVAEDRHLRTLRVVVLEHAAEPICVVGLLRPVVVLDACFARESDDAMLHAALLHEHAHIVGRDTLRTFLVGLCLSANPAGGLLLQDFRRWRSAREAVCDGEAVHRGGEPLALAQGLLRAARFRCSGWAAAMSAPLCGHDATALKLRLALLLQGPAVPVRTLGHVALGLGIAAALLTPHIGPQGVLEHFHFEVERLLRLAFTER